MSSQYQTPETPPSCFDFFLLLPPICTTSASNSHTRQTDWLPRALLLHKVKESSTLKGRRRRFVARDGLSSPFIPNESGTINAQMETRSEERRVGKEWR